MSAHRPPRTALRVVIADHRAAGRATLRALVERWGWFVVGEATDGLSAMRLARELAPDVLLTDGSIDHGIDLALLQDHFHDDPATAVVGLIDFPAQHAGARGPTVLKGAPLEHLRAQIVLAAHDTDKPEMTG